MLRRVSLMTSSLGCDRSGMHDAVTDLLVG
jgi:hypothetical protein